ncbi:MAG: hypothetical protein LH645_04075 [Actinomycetia bacterium]|nr:hypothetical protein [Actinomycetes bacterium]
MGEPAAQHAGERVLWDRWLWLTILAVAAAAALFIVARGLTDVAFDWLIFGAATSPVPEGEAQGYVSFVDAVLGAVMIGWIPSLWPLARGPLRRRERWARSAVTGSVAAWFVVDSTASLLLGFAENAVLNLTFTLVFAVPLFGMRSEGSSHSRV